MLFNANKHESLKQVWMVTCAFSKDVTTGFRQQKATLSLSWICTEKEAIHTDKTHSTSYLVLHPGPSFFKNLNLNQRVLVLEILFFAIWY